MQENLHIKKYEELYFLAKSALADEVATFDRHDTKASQYVVIVTLLLAISGFVGNYILANIVPPSNLVEWLALLVAFTYLGMLVAALIHVFYSIRSQQVLKISVGQELIAVFNQEEYLDLIYSLTRQMTTIANSNSRILLAKVRKLSHAHRLIVVSFALVPLLVALLTYAVWIRHT